jgi:hypothetical protein
MGKEIKKSILFWHEIICFRITSVQVIEISSAQVKPYS